MLNIDLDALEARQQHLADLVLVPTPPLQAWTPRPGALVLALDIQYVGDDAHVSADLHHLGGDTVGTFAGVTPASFPYLPGFFCFREGPPLLALAAHLAREGFPRPDVLIIDGHGLAHPRRFGVACWMGLALDTPAIGCAKETLVRFSQKPPLVRGAWTPVEVDGQTVGAVLCPQDGVQPSFVSPGHRVGLLDAVDAVLALGGEFRVPDPIRRADQAARAHSRGETPGASWTDLGLIPPAEPPWDTR